MGAYMCVGCSALDACSIDIEKHINRSNLD